jgi:hypothetical protein
MMRWFLPIMLSVGCSISSAQIEPNAGNWKTWVLTSSDQLRLPPPPDEAATRAEIAQLKDIAKQRNAGGTLTAVPGSPFAAGSGPSSVAITPLVPFASSFAKLEITAGPPPGFVLNGNFTLGKNTNGVNPPTEDVTLQIGTFSVTIPAGSFKQIPQGSFAFEGVINGVSLEVQIVSLGNNIFTFQGGGTGVI